MPEVTVFTPSYEGMVSTDYGPHVYQGRLSPERILEIGRKFGSGYARTALAKCPQPDEWYLSYNNNPDVEPERDEDGERYTDEHEGTGTLAYYVSIVKLN